MNEPIERGFDFFSVKLEPKITNQVCEIDVEKLPVDMDYIEIMRPKAVKVREYFEKIAEELNKVVWK